MLPLPPPSRSLPLHIATNLARLICLPESCLIDDTFTHHLTDCLSSWSHNGTVSIGLDGTALIV